MQAFLPDNSSFGLSKRFQDMIFAAQLIKMF